MSEFPYGWKRAKLRELIREITAGQSPNRMEHRARHGKKGILKTTAIQWGKFDPSENLEALPGFSANENTIVRKDDILITKAGPSHRVGVVALSTEDSKTLHVSGKMAILRVNETADPTFLAHQISHYDFQRQLLGDITGMAQSQTNFTHENLLSKEVLLPPLHEQKKIAEILSGIDQVVDALEKQEVKNLDLALSIAQGVFETNRESMRLGDLSTLITKGTTPTSLGMSFSEQGINFIKVESILEDGIFDPSKFSFVSPDVHIALKRSQIQSDDILFTIAGATVGKIALAQEHLLPANTNQALAIIRVNREVLRPQFAYYWLKSRTIKGIVEKHQTVGAQPNVSLSQIGDFPVPPISLEKQDGICRRLDSIDKMLHLIREKILRLKYLRQSLSSDLLSGSKRVSI